LNAASAQLAETFAQQVIGANVHERSGRRVGTIDDIVTDPESADIVFAVVGFGGRHGMPEAYYPIPWESLMYDERTGGYVGSFTRRQLEGPPAGFGDD
jgi:sporulation protein YlmC with PRC-barrel domain